MAYWIWNDSLSVGIPVIDNQHKRIVEYINELNTASRYNDTQQVYSVLLHLIDYTVSHFLFEEHLMEQANYSMLEPHKIVHQAFIRRIEHYKERYDNGENVTKQLMAELQIWLTNHIKQDDKDYKEIVKHMLNQQIVKSTTQKKEQNWLSSMVSKFFK